MLSSAAVSEIADRLEAARAAAKPITKVTDDYPDMDVADAYAVQRELLGRWQAVGRRLSGYKAGLTSKAKMAQMGVSVPSFAFLTNDMARPDRGVVEMDGLIHPRVEAEIAFVTRDALRGPGCTVEAVITATDFVVPAIEILDSRYEAFKFDLVSVIADNASSAGYVTGGRPRRVADLDLRTLGVTLERNGEMVGMAASAAVLGNPAASVAMLVDFLATCDEELPAGSFVMTGGVTEAIAVEAGDCVTAQVQELGSVSIRFV